VATPVHPLFDADEHADARVDGVDIHATNFTPVITYHHTVNGKRLAGSKLARTQLRTSDAAARPSSSRRTCRSGARVV